MRREERQRERESTQAARKRKRIIKITAVLLVVFGLGFGIFKYFTTPPKDIGVSADALATCVNHGVGSVIHIHPVLKIKINGKEQEIPKGVGISAFCMRPIHTHDSSGTLHLEFPRPHDFTLGDFFKVWDKPFPVSSTLSMTVNGEANTEFENRILRDGELIEVSYEEVQ